MRKTFKTGDEVWVGTHTTIPLRYENRLAVIVGREKRRGGFAYAVSFAPRRVNPLVISSRHLTLVE